jgi:hypothetical protein
MTLELDCTPDYQRTERSRKVMWCRVVWYVINVSEECTVSICMIEERCLSNLTIDSYCVRFEVLTAVTVKITVFWYVTTSGLVDHYQSFEETCCLHLQGPRLLILLLLSSSSNSSSLHNHHRENIKSHTVTVCGAAYQSQTVTIRNKFCYTRRRIHTINSAHASNPTHDHTSEDHVLLWSNNSNSCKVI